MRTGSGFSPQDEMPASLQLCTLAVVQGRSHARSPRSAPWAGGEGWVESWRPEGRPGWLLPSGGAPGRCQATRVGAMGSDGAFAFFWVISQLKSHQCCLARGQPWLPDAPTCPVLDPRELWVSGLSWHSVGDRGGTWASFHPAPRAWGTYLTSSVNEQTDDACLPPAPSQAAGQDRMRHSRAAEHRRKEGMRATPGSVPSQA